MIKRILATFLAATLFPACDASQVDPNADVHITVHATRPDGEPAKDLDVALNREADLADALITLTFLGLICLASDPPATCDHAKAETDGSGVATFDLKGSDTQGMFGQARTLALSAELPREDAELAGPASSIRFQVQTTKVDLDMSFWRPSLEFASDQLNSSVKWSDLPDKAVPARSSTASPSHGLVFETGGNLIWMIDEASSGNQFDARLLEDVRGSYAVSAFFDDIKTDAARGVGLELLLRSHRKAFRGLGGKPDSRGRPCTISVTNAAITPLSPCPVTDGRFGPSSALQEFSSCPRTQASPCADQPTSVQIDLGTPIDVNLVVIRGCRDTCKIELSQDAANWHEGGVATAEDGNGITALQLANAINARFIRVANDANLRELIEVSVFDSIPPPKEPELPVQRDDRRLGPFALSPPAPLAMYAVIALIFALGVGAFAMYGRKKQRGISV